MDVREFGDGFELDESRGLDQVFFEEVEQVDASGLDLDGTIGLELFLCCLKRGSVGVFKAVHRRSSGYFCGLRRSLSALRTRSGVMGSSKRRAPVALYTAFAMAAAVGTVVGSPSPSACVLLEPA